MRYSALGVTVTVHKPLLTLRSSKYVSGSVPEYANSLHAPEREMVPAGDVTAEARKVVHCSSDTEYRLGSTPVPIDVPVRVRAARPGVGLLEGDTV